MRPHRQQVRSLAALAAAFALGLPAVARAQAKAPAPIYSCVDDQGHRLTADRPIPECAAKEQQVLNSDGSLRMIRPPTLTPEERSAKEARDRALADARAAQADAVRRDRNLMLRYPNEQAHEKAREAALDTVHLAMKATEIRLRQLAEDRKPLRDEAEFYVGKPLPPKLAAAIDANDAAVAAQREATVSQQAEIERINKLYDAELDHLRKLWAGAAPGSLGSLPARPR